MLLVKKQIYLNILSSIEIFIHADKKLPEYKSI